MFQFLWTLIGPDSIGIEEETLASGDEQLMLDQLDKPIVSQTPAQAQPALNVEELIIGQINVQTEEDNSTSSI